MARSDQDSNDRQPKRVVYEHELAALAAIKEYRQWKFSDQPVPDAIQRQLAEEALAFREVLHKYRREGALDPEWGERDIHWIEEYQNHTVTVEEPAPGITSNTQEVQRPAILTVDPERLVDVIRNLEDIADELGFSAATTTETDHNQIDHDDLASLLQLRDQDEALDRVPGGDS